MFDGAFESRQIIRSRGFSLSFFLFSFFKRSRVYLSFLFSIIIPRSGEKVHTFMKHRPQIILSNALCEAPFFNPSPPHAISLLLYRFRVFARYIIGAFLHVNFRSKYLHFVVIVTRGSTTISVSLFGLIEIFRFNEQKIGKGVFFFVIFFSPR